MSTSSASSSSSATDRFAELETRILRTVEMVKTLRREKESAEKELAAVSTRAGKLEREIEDLRGERDLIKGKVESLLENLAALTEEALV